MPNIKDGNEILKLLERKRLLARSVYALRNNRPLEVLVVHSREIQTPHFWVGSLSPLEALKGVALDTDDMKQRAAILLARLIEAEIMLILEKLEVDHGFELPDVDLNEPPALVKAQYDPEQAEASYKDTVFLVDQIVKLIQHDPSAFADFVYQQSSEPKGDRGEYTEVPYLLLSALKTVESMLKHATADKDEDEDD